MLLAESTARFLPPLDAGAVAALVGAALAVLLAARWLLGPANEVARRWSLWIVRGVILALVALVLLNPVRVEELPGPVQRPEIFYLLDTSSSMQMGAPRSRWDESLALLRGAQQLSPEARADVKAFRFGQRLAAVDPAVQLGLTNVLVASGLKITPASLQSAEKSQAAIPLLPTDADTRMLAALRQISSRFGRVPPQGIVLVSDGRAHDEVGLEQLAAEFARLKVPIHVAPVGDTTKGGDVAVSAVVAPPRARKFTEVDVQVFVRSFGYDGKRSEVQLLELQEDGTALRKLCPPLPITLQSGFQSVSLSFRTDLTTRKLRVAIPALADEVTPANNQIDAEMQIERTKIRVLYVEGSNQPLTQVRVGDRYQIRGAFSDLKAALTEDEDIECVVLVAQPGVGLARIAEYASPDGVRGFPTTVAELSAFDALILSNVAADQFTQKQLEWIEHWIGQRGGGLCMLGGENSFSSGGWRESQLAPLLPVELAPGGYDWIGGEPIKIAAEMPPSPHALWAIVADEQQNRQIVGTFPQVLGINRWLGARPNLTRVLAATSISGTPAAPPPEPLTLRSFGTILQGAFQPKPSAPRPRAAQAESVPPPGPAADVPAIVAGRYGRGRTMAVAIPLTSPAADELVLKWGSADNRYYAKFCRNLVNWLTESSMIGRRRLVATTDKRFYRPGEMIAIQAATYDESAAPTKNYRVVAMVEPHSAPGESEPETSPLKWPSGLARTSGETGPHVAWGEEFELALGGAASGAGETPLHQIKLPLADVLSSGASSQSLRVELTAYEDRTQVDSTSLDIQVLHDPFEQQNPFPNHELLARLAAASGGKVIRSPAELAALLREVPLDVGPPVIRRSPLWSTWWLWGLIVCLLTVEWCWRRSLGLA